MKRLHRESIVQFLKFGIVGVSNTVISLAVYYAVLWIDRDWYLAGNVLGWIIGVANAYFWNHRYVFKTKTERFSQKLKELGKTYLSYGVTFFLSTILLYVEVELADFSAVLCPIANLLITIPLNFVLNKFWTFK